MSAAVRLLLVAAITLAVSVDAALAQPAPPVLNAQAVGQVVSASWAPVAGATGYRAEAGVSPGQMLAAYELGPLTGFSIAAPQGIFYLRVLARNAQGLSLPSNIVAVAVNSVLSPPGPPINLQAGVVGNTVHFSVQPPASGQLTGMVLAVGGAPAQTQLVLPVTALQSSVPNVPPGSYFARMHAVGPGGTSGPSNEVQVTVGLGSCSAPSPPAVQTQVNGSTVGISWTAVAGASTYRLDAAMAPGGAPFLSQPQGPGTTSVAYSGVVPGTYYIRVTAGNSCGAQATSADATVVVVSTGGTSGPRTPNPPSPTPPNYLPLPNRSAVVDEMARLYPSDLRNSCVEHGGNNRWLFRLVERLRREDTRWGLNWKRARTGDMSQDVIAYNYGPEGDEGTLYVHVVDVIGGHCGGNPSGAWINQTVLWSTGAKWTLQPYLQAGLPQFPQ